VLARPPAGILWCVLPAARHAPLARTPAHRSLRGTLPLALTTLSHLAELDVSDNPELGGTLPRMKCVPRRLRVLAAAGAWGVAAGSACAACARSAISRH
jgi:hypothetical protein